MFIFLINAVIRGHLRSYDSDAAVFGLTASPFQLSCGLRPVNKSGDVHDFGLLEELEGKERDGVGLN